MRARLVAAATGTLVVAAAALAFSLGSHPVIAGTNTVEPLYAAVNLQPGGRHCQSQAAVPSGATQLLMALDSQTPGRGKLRAKITAGRGAVASGRARGLQPGLFGISLTHKTKAARHATLCVTNPGRAQLVLSGESKKVHGQNGHPERAGVASVVFLEPHTATWLDRARAIARRFGNGQAGALGTWALLAAALLALAAWGLAMWWLVNRPEESN